MKKLYAALALVVAFPFATQAAPRTVTAHLPGLSCMSLRVSDQQAMDPTFVVPLHAQPSSAAPSIGRASSIVIVRSPQVEQDGFIAAVLFNGRAGWISAADLKPWVNPGSNGQRCIPSRMSDGSIGFDFK